MPALIVHSRTDRLAPIEQAERASNTIPNTEIFVFEDEGHVCFVIHKEEFVTKSVNFLENSVQLS